MSVMAIAHAWHDSANNSKAQYSINEKYKYNNINVTIDSQVTHLERH